MKNCILLFILLNLFFAEIGIGQTGELNSLKLEGKSEFIEKHENDDTIYITKNHRFNYIFLNIFDKFQTLILSQNFKNEFVYGTEGVDSECKIEAYLAEMDHYKKIWEYQDNFDDGDFNDEFYILTNYGCCGEAPIYKYLDIRTGKELFMTTGNIIKIYYDTNGNKLIISFLSKDSAVRTEELTQIKSGGLLNIYNTEYQSLITYGIESKVKRSFYPKLYLKNETTNDTLDSINLKPFESNNYLFYLEIDPKNFLKFKVDRFSVKIPDTFENDLFIVEKLKSN